MVQMLLSNGANVDQQDDVCSLYLCKHARLLSIILYIHASQDGISPLHWAILHNHVDVVQVLLENGAPTDSFDKVLTVCQK